MRGNIWRTKPLISDEKIKQLAQAVIESGRHFWNDYDFPIYLITFLSSGDNFRLDGTGVFNAFSMFLSDQFEEKPDMLQAITRLLSHEHFHTWNGMKIHPSSPEESLYWFHEGFTEYYAGELN